MAKPRLLRITTVPVSLKLLLNGQLTFFQQQGFEVLTASASGPEVSYLNEHNIKHSVIPMTRSITPFRDFFCLIRLIVLIKKFNPDIVHTHTPKAGLLGMMAAWVCRVPIRLHTVAGLPLMEATGIKHFVLKVTERITYACAHRVYPNSTGLLEYIRLKFKVADNLKFKIIGKGSSNGIDPIYFSRNEELIKQAKSIRARYDIPDDAVVFCFVGRVVKDKGLVELVDAFQKLKDMSVRLLMIGSIEPQLDPLPAETLTFIESDNRIIKAGFQQDVRPWMVASDVFVFPSYREGFPNVLLQASCLEIPGIASDINGCNEIIQQDKTGILVPAKDTDALKNAMLALGRDKAKQLTFGRESRKFVVSNFDQQFVWNELLKEYQFFLNFR